MARITLPEIEDRAFVVGCDDHDVASPYLDFDPSDGTWSWGHWPHHMAHSAPESVWNGRELRLSVPANAKTAAVLGVLRERLSDLQQIADRFEVVWNGSNHVGRFGGDVDEYSGHGSDAELWMEIEWSVETLSGNDIHAEIGRAHV